MAANKKLPYPSAEHPRFSVLDDAPRAKQTLIDIGLPRKAEKDGTVHNRGFGDWDGEIIHIYTSEEVHTLILIKNVDWSVEQVETAMERYVSVFQTVNDEIEYYDFHEVAAEEMVQWDPIPSGRRPPQVEDNPAD
tara:strand:- start:5283 stop:5687 length:405 start_codon:yes stop_codon:yes gene_type:complete